MDLDRVLRARVKALHELLKQGYTTTVISRYLPYTCAPFIFAHAATPTVLSITLPPDEIGVVRC